MGQYQARKWLGWQHHMALVELAMLFVLQERQVTGETVPLLSARDVVEMLDWWFGATRTRTDVEAAIRARHARRTRQAAAAQRRTKRPPKPIIQKIPK